MLGIVELSMGTGCSRQVAGGRRNSKTFFYFKWLYRNSTRKYASRRQHGENDVAPSLANAAWTCCYLCNVP
jgi:hypothetical protein